MKGFIPEMLGGGGGKWALGYSHFKFIISGDQDLLPLEVKKSLSYKSFIIPKFTFPETKEFFGDLIEDAKEMQAIHRFCNTGFPESLAAVKRELEEGIELDTILTEQSATVLNFAKRAWERANIIEEEEKIVLAVLAFSQNSLTSQDIALVTGVDVNDIEKLVRKSPLLNDAVDEVMFISPSHRSYASEQLREYKNKSIDLIIENLRGNVSNLSQDTLADYYNLVERHDETLNFLTPEIFIRILENNEMLYPVRKQTENGISASKALGRFEELLSFCLQNSVLRQLNQAEIWDSEIEARLALKDFDSALSLARSSVLKEDRVRLLSSIAGRLFEDKGKVQYELIEEIRLLITQIPENVLGESALEIATNLVAFEQDLAIDLVDLHTNSQSDSDLSFFTLLILLVKSKQPISKTEKSLSAQV